MNYKTLVFGCSGTVGLEFINVNKDKNILYYSRKKPKKISKKFWRYIDLKKIKNRTEIKIFIYLSSSSVYLNDHPVGTAKLACEKYLINNSNYDYLQIWRPYNLIGNENLNLSDHFHNLLIKKFCLEGKKNHHFYGSANDVRGYSSAIKFYKSLINKSNLNKNFIYEYGNSNTIKVKQVANIFKKIFERKFKKKIKYIFN